MTEWEGLTCIVVDRAGGAYSCTDRAGGTYTVVVQTGWERLYSCTDGRLETYICPRKESFYNNST